MVNKSGTVWPHEGCYLYHMSPEHQGSDVLWHPEGQAKFSRDSKDTEKKKEETAGLES